MDEIHTDSAFAETDSAPADPESPGRASRARPGPLVVWVLLAAGIAASFAGALVTRNETQQESRRAFRATAKDVTANLVTVLNRDADLVWTLRGIATMAPRMDNRQLRTSYELVKGPERQQQEVGVGVLASVRASELAGFLASRGTATRVVPAGKRARYCLTAAWLGGTTTSSTASLPSTADFCALRLPVLGRLTLSDALLHQAATGELFAGADLPVADVDSVYMSAPFYRRGTRLTTSRQRSAATRGWVVIAFDRRALLRSAMGSHTGLQLQLLRANVGESSPRSVAQVGSAPDGSLSYRQVAFVHGQWVVLVRGLPAGAPNATLLGALVLAGGLVMSVLLFLLLRTLTRSRERALGLVRKRTGQLRHQALHDALTGLPNRLLVLDRGAQMLARARRDQSRVAVLYVDLDGFKQINDTFGHAAGDKLLQIVGARLATVMRAGDTVGRMSGDEFVVLLDARNTDATPELIAERVLEVLGRPFSLTKAGRSLSIGASVGIAEGDGSAADLLRDADVALYEAKAAGKNRWVVFESRMQTAAHERLELEMDLREALARGQLFCSATTG